MAQEHIETMLAAWRQYIATGSATARDVAFELADRNRLTNREKTDARSSAR